MPHTLYAQTLGVSVAGIDILLRVLCWHLFADNAMVVIEHNLDVMAPG